ncbi:hypothetical protein C2G38_2106883 [Gigaspora rosea]|uniref:Uncharacterized protein n=1 Tax=Gigaspora rosea TaxID=44941 RepID=A0A397UIL6_9GLOM|nr:hypothetical protein C2G38_2106883 [Gigaspora rosea]
MILLLAMSSGLGHIALLNGDGDMYLYLFDFSYLSKYCVDNFTYNRCDYYNTSSTLFYWLICFPINFFSLLYYIIKVVRLKRGKEDKSIIIRNNFLNRLSKYNFFS